MKKILLMCCLFIGSIAAVNAQTNHAATSADPKEKAIGLKKQLKLSDKQTTKIAAIYKESAEEYDKIKAEDKGNTNKMLQAVGPLRAATIKKIKKVLTPTQAVKFDKLIKDSKKSSSNGGWSDGWSDGWSSTTN
jgi:periplasmic protein CpxP/Spy